METLLFIVCGVVSGLLAGMLGIGGGLVVVPALYACLRWHGADASLIPQIAVATSLAAMIPTAAAASWAQWRRGALAWTALRRLAPGVALGAAFGAWLAGNVRGSVVSLAFVAYAGYFAWRMWRSARVPAPVATASQAVIATHRSAPFAARLPVGAVGLFIGVSSALAGVGGAIVTVPYLVACSVDMKRAVAASSAVGFVISISATLAYAAQASQHVSDTAAFEPASMLGFVYWPAALVIGVAALLSAPCGVAWSHRVPVQMLKRLFALLSLAAAAGTLASVLR